MSPRLLRSSASSVLACFALACGARSSTTASSTPASSTTATTTRHEATPPSSASPGPTPAEILRRGCPATYAEALLWVGTLRATPQPEAPGIERPMDLEPIVVQQPIAPEWPEVCAYAEGDCRVLRYESNCTDYVAFRCGVPADAALDSFQPCDRPDRP